MAKQVFQPKVVLSVTILEHRNILLGWLQDLVDTPDPYISVYCPWLDKKNKYSTLVKENQPTAKVNETFRFVIPDDKHDMKQIVEIRIHDQDFLWDDRIGQVSFDAGTLSVGENISKTVVLKDGRGELDIEICKYLQIRVTILAYIRRMEPHFRLSEEVCDEEKIFLDKRMPKVKEKIQSFLGPERFPINLDETPKISVVGSGGGYRAVIGMSGGMAALKDAGLLDALTYTSGLSGSAWYLCSAYSHGGMNSETQKEYHEWLKNQMEDSVYSNLFNPIFYAKYKFGYNSRKEQHDQPTTLVDYYGYAVGNRLLGEKLDHTMSHIRETVSDGEVPFPILSSVHLEEDTPSYKFHVHMENTPHEISMPRYGVNIATKHFGSHWDEGIVTRECPEFPLHYYIGSCGCAFSILLNFLIKHGGEISPGFLAEIEELRDYADSKSVAIALAEECLEVSDGKNENSDEPLPSTVFSLIPSGILEKAKEFFTDRSAVIDRTAKVPNFAHNMEPLPDVYPKLPQDISQQSEFQKQIIEKAGYREKQTMASHVEHFSVCDSGIVKNVDVESFLRPSRFSDLIIVFDMNNYESDEYFDYMTIIQSAEHAWRNGFPFPPIKLKELVNKPPTEFLVLESDSDDCPTVLWFTLSNKKFRDIKDYNPQNPFDESLNDGRPFNDFPVFGSDSNYKTHNFSYTNLQFDQLHELMYFNVMSHIPEIKEHIINAMERRSRRQNKCKNNSVHNLNPSE